MTNVFHLLRNRSLGRKLQNSAANTFIKPWIFDEGMQYQLQRRILSRKNIYMTQYIYAEAYSKVHSEDGRYIFTLESPSQSLSRNSKTSHVIEHTNNTTDCHPNLLILLKENGFVVLHDFHQGHYIGEHRLPILPPMRFRNMYWNIVSESLAFSTNHHRDSQYIAIYDVHPFQLKVLLYFSKDNIPGFKSAEINSDFLFVTVRNKQVNFYPLKLVLEKCPISYTAAGQQMVMFSNIDPVHSVASEDGYIDFGGCHKKSPLFLIKALSGTRFSVESLTNISVENAVISVNPAYNTRDEKPHFYDNYYRLMMLQDTRFDVLQINSTPNEDIVDLEQVYAVAMKEYIHKAPVVPFPQQEQTEEDSESSHSDDEDESVIFWGWRNTRGAGAAGSHSLPGKISSQYVYSRRGRKIRKIDYSVDEENIHSVNYENELDLIVVAHGGYAYILRNHDGLLIRKFKLQKWTEKYCTVLLDRDLLVHLYEEESRKFNCDIYKLKQLTS
eukprot:TRINITY_DN2074_c0_g1_i1.p1 TRINITY_DN2074_c0_g1~~TRINITY_DN2074_c0_g1_i1.p1  ORF type:complete len:498 (-),score=83.81 TRINITY_DN2074_c0_g1_i1:174-1667(-)